jgi:hypothetical protein
MLLLMSRQLGWDLLIFLLETSRSTGSFKTQKAIICGSRPQDSKGGNGVTGLRFESCLIDSQLSGSPTGAGVGFRVRASNPGFVWKAKIGHIYIRGFDDGLVIDCDVNLGEVFDNDFDQIEVVSCDDRSLDIKGIYNRFGRIFVTESGNYAMVNASSACTFEQIVTDGPVTFSAAGGWIGLLAIEGTNGSGATSLIDLSGPNYTFDNIVCKDIPNAKYTYGLAVSGSSTGLFFGSIVFTGTVPPQPILLTAGSAGIIGNASIPSGTKISTSTSVIATWRFIGDVSSAFQGDRYLDPNLLVQYTGETVAKGPLYLTAAATNPGAGNVALGKSTATSIGAAGGASALPATPLGYLIAYVGTTQVKIPYYNA